MDETLIFWDEEHQVKGNGGFGRIIEVGSYIIATTNRIEVFNKIPPQEKAYNLSGHKKRIRGICELQLKNYKNPLIATGGDDALIKIWDLKVKSHKFTTIEGQTGSVMCLLQHSSQCLISGGGF